MNRLKDSYSIGQAWRDLGLAGEPGKTCRSPWPDEHAHGDANPSFSVFHNGQRWKDFATGGSGDVIDFVAKARQCTKGEAIGWIRDRLGIPSAQVKPTISSPPRLPALHRSGEGQLSKLCEQRGFGLKGLQLAENRGLLRFATLWGQSAWCVTDSRRQLVEFRRLDGAKWPPLGRLQERKTHCMGTGKSWPIGTMEAEPYPKVAMVEGAPDLLAACHFLVAEGKESTVAPVAVLGASNHRLDREALERFKGKEIWLYPHVDESGRTCVTKWAKSLKDAGAARVAAFDLSGLVLVDGSKGKDLADVCRMDVDTWERERKFWEVMP